MRGWILLVAIGLAGRETPYRSCISDNLPAQRDVQCNDVRQTCERARENEQLCSVRISARPDEEPWDLRGF